MKKLLNTWMQRHFSDPQVIILAFLLLLGTATIFFIGDILVPVIAALILAYVLDGAVNFLTRRLKIHQTIAVAITFSIFIILLLSVLFVLAPLMIRQASQFVLQIPSMMSHGQDLLMQLPTKYPNLISEKHVLELVSGIRLQVAEISQGVVSFSLSSVANLLSFMVYLIMVPLLVFFFLYDKEKMINWFTEFLPTDRSLVSTVWAEVNIKSAGYIRGKFVEILLIWFVSLVTFLWLGLDYAMLLSFMVGISVLIPYVGAAVVTIPIAIVAYFQWGFDSNFAYIIIAYGIIQFIDGNLLVPFLFSEMVNLHPAAIITAVLLFGGLWGVMGVFFAIPLATLIHAVINSWPKNGESVEVALP
ncbi:MAG: AI-2E family transporter [Thiotrichaceae bacterium]